MRGGVPASPGVGFKRKSWEIQTRPRSFCCSPMQRGGGEESDGEGEGDKPPVPKRHLLLLKTQAQSRQDTARGIPSAPSLPRGAPGVRVPSAGSGSARRHREPPGRARPVPAHLAPGGQPRVNRAAGKGQPGCSASAVIAAARPQRHIRRCSHDEGAERRRRRRGWRGRPGGACAGAEERGAPAVLSGPLGIPGWPLSLPVERS